MAQQRRLWGWRPFYGWYIVAVAILAHSLHSMVVAFGFSTFMKPMTTELGWSRTQFSSGVTLLTAVIGMGALFVGPILDRRGAREVMAIGAAVAGVGFILLSRVQNLWQFYLIYGLVVALGYLGTSHLITNVAISNWFIAKRGRAVTIAAMGIPLSHVIMPPIAAFLIAQLGWRSALVATGLMFWVVIILPSLLIVRRRPEDMGLLPDQAGPGASSSIAPSPVRASPGKAVEEITWTRREVLRTPALWLIMASFGLAGLGARALMIHFHPYLTDRGFSLAAATAMVSVLSMPSIPVKPFWGLMMERVDVRYCAMSTHLLRVLAMVVFMSSNNIGVVYLGLILYGTAAAAFQPVEEVIWANYYGRLSLGTVRSVGLPFSVIASAGGPLLAGFLYDLTGSYNLALFIFIAFFFASIVLILLARKPRKASLGSQGQFSTAG